MIAAATVSLIIGVAQHGWAEGWTEGVTIYIAVVIIVSVTVGNDYIKEKQFQKLNAVKDKRNVTVIRGGETIQICIFDLLVGDILQISEGDLTPADCVLIKGTDVYCNESNLTGEPENLKKEPLLDGDNSEHPDPFMIGSSKIVSGKGFAVVLAVGKSTMQGRIEEKLAGDQE